MEHVHHTAKRSMSVAEDETMSAKEVDLDACAVHVLACLHVE